VNDISLNEPEAPLRAYLQAKEAVAALLRDVQEFADHSAPWASERIHHLMARLGEDRFTLVVLGQFKRGKSSLMNAIVGQPLLPTGLLPVTSAITALRYGSTLRAVVKRAGFAVDQHVPIAELPAFITEKGNPGNEKQVLSADIEVPAPFLRRGLYFVDTPGIGSAHEHNTATTLSFLPEADAAIFVTGADGPLSDVELQFLDAVREHVRKIFFVLNKIDQVPPEQAGEVVDYTLSLLERHLGSQSIRLFPFSATHALAAHDPSTTASSGLAELEGALATFLNDERRVVFLVALLDRIGARLDEIGFMLGLRQSAAEQLTDGNGQRLEALNQQLDEIEGDRQRLLQQLDERVTNWKSGSVEPALEEFARRTLESLTTALPHTVKAFAATSPTFAAEAFRWFDMQIREHADRLAQILAEDVKAFAASLTARTRSDMRAILLRPREVAASVLRASHRHSGSDEDGLDVAWTGIRLPELPKFSTPPPIGAPEPTQSPLPQAIAIRLVSRQLTQNLPARVHHVAEALRAHINTYLTAIHGALDDSSKHDLAEERQRLELAINPKIDANGSTANGEERLDVLERLRTHVNALRDALLRDQPVPAVQRVIAPAGAPLDSARPSSAAASGPSAVNGSTRSLGGTCPICAAASNALFDFLCQYQYAITRDDAAQRQSLAAQGLCPPHTWHLEGISSPRGLSLGYPPLLDRLEERVRALMHGTPDGAVTALHALEARSTTCAACIAVRSAEQRAAATLIATLKTPEGLASFEARQWLCLAHLRLILTGLEEPAAAAVLRRQARRIGELAESMREYVIKHDARRRHLMTDEEVRAYRQALVLLVGERYLFRTEQEE